MVRPGWTYSQRRGWRVVALAVAVTLGASSIGAQHIVSSTDRRDAHTIARRYFEEVWNQGRLEVLDELLSPTYIDHTPSVENPAPGPDGLKPIIQIERVRDGRIVEHWRVTDELTLMRQLGVV